MRTFLNNQPLLDSITANDLDEIRRTLIDNIFFLQGNRDEIEKAIQYATDNSKFVFEPHKAIKVSDTDNKNDFFSDEKWNMRENYSRERYNLLVELYNETFAKQEYIYDTEDQPFSLNTTTKYIIIGGAIVLASYLLYKTLN